MLTQDDVIDVLRIDLMGIVPDDESIVIATNRGEVAVLDRQSRAGQAYTNVGPAPAGRAGTIPRC